MYALEEFFVWVMIAIPAIGLSIWIYLRLFMRRGVDLGRHRRRAIVAGIAGAVWLANFYWPVCYGDGTNWDIRFCFGLLQYHEGEIFTHVSALQADYYGFSDGLNFDSRDRYSDATPPEAGPYMPWSMLLFPMYRHHGKGYAWHFPLWPLFALPIACWVVEAYRCRRLIKFNLCPTCQYNLTGSPDRCPECGEDVPVRPTVTICPVNSPRFDQ